MRIGIFSDTHANIEALEVVLRALDDEAVDERVCLGDTVGYGASPNECCALIRSRTAHTILGNHDAAVAGRMDYSYYYHAARHALDMHARLLTPENMQWLKNLPYEVRKGDVHFCHGSPLNIEEFDYIFARDQAAQCLEIWDDLSPLTLIGHSHLCKSFALSPDGVHEVVADKFELRPGLEVHRQRRLGRPAARLRPARQLRHLRHRQAPVRVPARRVRREDLGGEDLRVGPRAELRPSSLHRRLTCARRLGPRWWCWPRSRSARGRAWRRRRARPASRTIRSPRPPATPAGSARPR